MECLRDLQWWLHLPRLSLGVSLCQVSPDLRFWSDASDVGWGAHLDRRIASGLWAANQAALSITARELLAVKLDLPQFPSSLQGCTVAAFCDNTTAVAYLRKKGGTRSPPLNIFAQVILSWSESLSVRLTPQFLPGSNNVLADALSRPHQLPHSEWSLNLTVFQSLRSLWPVQIDLFATSANHRCSIYFSPFRDPISAGTEHFSSPGKWLHTGPGALGSPTCSSFRWLLQWSCRAVKTSCACLGLVIFTRISVGSGFMPGDSPAIYQSRWLLLRSSGAVFAGAPSILARSISGAMVHLSCVVSQQWPFCLSSYLV